MNIRHLLLLVILFFVACGGIDSDVESTVESVEPASTDSTSDGAEAGVNENEVPHLHDSEDEATHTHDETTSSGVGLDVSLFFDGALADDVTTEPCTLSGGTETTCYRITIVGYPTNYEIGPFCPTTTSTSADDAGIWLDGNGVYDADGAFILGLAELYDDDNWRLYDDEGNVNVTETAEEFEAAARPNVDPALQNHCVEGRIEWLADGEPIPTTVLIPTSPVVASESAAVRTSPGIALNGVVIDPAAPVDAILSAYTIAAFDDCGGHINPFEGYHYHAAAGCAENGEVADGETPIFGYALDGFAIHSPLDEAEAAVANLDECSGHTTEADGYHYHAGAVETNAVLSCMIGETAVNNDGPPAGGPPAGGPPGGSGEAGADGEAAEVAADRSDAVINLDAFNRAGLVQEPAIVNCTLTDGTASQCAQLVIKNLPDDFIIGPHCPKTLAGAGGIWNWDGDNSGLYRLNEAFWRMVNGQGFSFYDESGNINLADPGPEGPTAVLEGNNCIEIAEDETAEVTALIPLYPTLANSVTQLGVVSQVGLALNSIPIFSDAPSVFVTNNLPALDPCGGHIDPGGWYHWHATATDIESSFEHEGVDADCHLEQSASGLFAYAFDGYPIYGSADAEGVIPTDLDECNGHTTATVDYPEGIYHYHATLDFPNLPTCLVGTRAENAFSTNRDTATPGGGQGQGGPPAGGQGGPGGAGQGAPDFAAAAEILGIAEQALRDALGGPPPNFEAAAETLGIPIEELQDALGGRP